MDEALLDANRWRERVRQSMSSLQNLRANLPDRAPRNERCVVVGEHAFVTLSLSNPLQVPLELKGFSLAYEIGDTPPSDSDPASGEIKPWEWAEETDEALEVESQDITIPGGGRREVRLRMVAKKEGWIRVRGVCWLLAGAALERPRDRRSQLSEVTALSCSVEAGGRLDPRLEMRAVSAMPRLEATLLGLPATALYGQVNIHRTLQ
ncbi:hypothetical protein T484DRAFT_1786080 [Baffinella frigidus]|nr:hypothetical protein T484DRAFT_1786080 [Cryptophyta sp. CCMP2293]